ncbi:MAG TPA: glycosyltransferase family 4 protein [Mucilaginibacter sp.]|jgi:glycosyltransferase involved in cell wall biosynthesis|nr:glycosyltransferase family 4 protein [Mucilaginibacter sp.]
MNKADTLIILSPGFPKDEADSTCVPPQQVFVKNLKKTYPGLKIVVLAFEYPYKAAEYQWNGVKVFAFGGRNKGGLNRIFNWRKIRAKLRELHDRQHVVGMLSFWLGDCALIGSRFAKGKNLPHFCWILGQDAKKGNRYFKLIKPKASTLIALSDFIAEHFGKNYVIVPEHVIPPGIDPDMFEKNSLQHDIDILGAGSLIPLKQFYMLVELVNTLKAQFPNLKASICGDGPEMRSLKAMIHDHGLHAHITLTGELPHAEVLKLMQRSKIFVHPSAYEGFGVVCLEALYTGAQIVSLVKPMKADIQNWHIARSQADMVDIVARLLNDPPKDHSQVAPYLVKDSAAAMMNLFGHSESTTS